MAIFGRKISVPAETNIRTIQPKGRGMQNFAEMEMGLLKDKVISNVLIACVVAVIIQAALILFNWGKLPQQLPLFYSRPWGDKILAGPLFLWILPLMLIIFTFLNFWLLTKVRDNNFVKKILIIFSLLNCFIFSYALTKLVSLVI